MALFKPAGSDTYKDTASATGQSAASDAANAAAKPQKTWEEKVQAQDRADTQQAINEGRAPSNALTYNPTDIVAGSQIHAQRDANDGAGMGKYHQDQLTENGKAWNALAAEKEQMLANAKTPEERAAISEFYDGELDKIHADSEKIRNQYGYSGGVDGSEFNPVAEKDSGGSSGGGSAGGQVDPIGNRAPDLRTLLDQWLAASVNKSNNQIDYAVNKGVTDLERAESDAQEQFQTQQDQISQDEAKALDNQALYAEARGDRGGIGQAQYAQIQAAAMQNRRAVNSARVKLSTDTARQIADLRAQGEFQKADALLELTQTYLGQLVDFEKWAAEFNLDVDMFNKQLEQWNLEFELQVGDLLGEYQGIPTLENQKFQASLQESDRSFLADSGLAALSVGIRPSASQQAAMGYTDDQIDAALAQYQLGLTTGNKTGSPSGGDDAPELSLSNFDYRAIVDAGRTTEAGVTEYLKALGFSDGDIKVMVPYYLEEWLPQYEESLIRGPLETGVTSGLGSKYSTVWGQARKMFDSGKTAEEIYTYLNKFGETELTRQGLAYILNSLNLFKAG